MNPERGIDYARLNGDLGLQYAIEVGNPDHFTKVLKQYDDADLSKMRPGVDFSSKDMDLETFINRFSNSRTEHKYWMGKLPKSFTDSAKSDLSKLGYDVDLSGRSLVLGSSGIAYTADNHGEYVFQIDGNSTPMTINDLENIANIITNYDEIEYTPNNPSRGERDSKGIWHDKGNRIGLTTKTDAGYKYFTLELVPTRGKELRLVTSYTFNGQRKGKINKGINRGADVALATPTDTSAKSATDSLDIPSNATLSNDNGNVNQHFIGLESAEAQDTLENKIYNSMSISEARRMLEKTWNQYIDCLQKDNWDTMQ